MLTAEVPHKISQIHIPYLVFKHELQVLPEGGAHYLFTFICFRVGYHYRFPSLANILLVYINMIILVAPHPREESHEPAVILFFNVVIGNDVSASRLVIDRFSLFVTCYRGIVIRPVEQWSFAILFPVQVIKK